MPQEVKVRTPVDRRVLKRECVQQSTEADPVRLDIVLAKYGMNGQFVTWMHNVNCDSYFWGHYYDTYEEALLSFHRRVAEKLERRIG